LALAANVAILTTWGSLEALPFAMSAAMIGESGFLPLVEGAFAGVDSRTEGRLTLFCGHSSVSSATRLPSRGIELRPSPNQDGALKPGLFFNAPCQLRIRVR